jgi:hypothetical protein
VKAYLAIGDVGLCDNIKFLLKNKLDNDQIRKSGTESADPRVKL